MLEDNDVLFTLMSLLLCSCARAVYLQALNGKISKTRVMDPTQSNKMDTGVYKEIDSETNEEWEKTHFKSDVQRTKCDHYMSRSSSPVSEYFIRKSDSLKLREIRRLLDYDTDDTHDDTDRGLLIKFT